MWIRFPRVRRNLGISTLQFGRLAVSLIRDINQSVWLDRIEDIFITRGYYYHHAYPQSKREYSLR